MSSYGILKRLPGATLDEAQARVTAALADQGFGVLTSIDIRATLKKKLDVDFRPYVILGACNPPLAHRALTADPQVGLLLPCNVVVQEDADGVLVSAIDPDAMLGLVSDPEMAAVAREAKLRLEKALAALG